MLSNNLHCFSNEQFKQRKELMCLALHLKIKSIRIINRTRKEIKAVVFLTESSLYVTNIYIAFSLSKAVIS